MKMYVYELPFEINKELCRLLDNYDYWEELAGNYMKYAAFDIIVSCLFFVSKYVSGIFPVRQM